MKINLDDLAFKIIVLSAIMIIAGIMLGTFIAKMIIYIAVLGAGLFLAGIVIFIANELKGDNNGKNVCKEEGESKKHQTSSES